MAYNTNCTSQSINILLLLYLIQQNVSSQTAVATRQPKQFASRIKERKQAAHNAYRHCKIYISNVFDNHTNPERLIQNHFQSSEPPQNLQGFWTRAETVFSLVADTLQVCERHNNNRYRFRLSVGKWDHFEFPIILQQYYSRGTDDRHWRFSMFLTSAIVFNVHFCYTDLRLQYG